MRYALALDLKNDPKLIEEYKAYHLNVWPEILSSLKLSGIREMEIYQVANRLLMIIETDPEFSFERKADLDRTKLKVVEWEALMDKYQDRLPFAKPDEKWVLMERIFKL